VASQVSREGFEIGVGGSPVNFLVLYGLSPSSPSTILDGVHSLELNFRA
jgi:hypothetical protein